MKYLYYKLYDLPCRIEDCKGLSTVEIYKPGVGFVMGSRYEIEFYGSAINKKEFDDTMIALSLKSNA